MADQAPQSSFIPKNSIPSPRPKRSVKRVYIFSYVAFVVFVGAVLAASGVVGYKVYLDTQKRDLVASLVAEAEMFNAASIDDILNLEKRLTTASSLMNRHIMLTDILDAMESTVVSRVTYNSLSMDRSEGALAFEFEGSTDIFDAVLFQDTVLAENSLFRSVTIDDLAYSSESSGGGGEGIGARAQEPITFQFSQSLSPADIAYVAAEESISDTEVTPNTTSGANATSSANGIIGGSNPAAGAGVTDIEQ